MRILAAVCAAQMVFNSLSLFLGRIYIETTEAKELSSEAVHTGHVSAKCQQKYQLFFLSF